jgi:hypothetical protein
MGGNCSRQAAGAEFNLMYFITSGGIEYDFVCECLKSEMYNKRGQVSKQSVEVPLSCQPANNGRSANPHAAVTTALVMSLHKTRCLPPDWRTDGTDSSSLISQILSQHET